MMVPSKEEVQRRLTTANIVIDNGLIHYKKTQTDKQKERKILQWNALEEEEEFVKDFSKIKGWTNSTWNQCIQTILFAKLIIATSEYLDNGNEEIIKHFHDTRAYELLEKYEEFAIFGDRNYSIDDIKERIANDDKKIIGFLENDCKKQFDTYNHLIGELNVERRIILELKRRYQVIFTRIQEAIVTYIKTHPGTWRRALGEIDDVIKEILESQKERLRLKAEIEKNHLAREKKEEYETMIDELIEECQKLDNKLIRAHRDVQKKEMETDHLHSKLETLEQEKINLLKQNDSLLCKMDDVFLEIDEKKNELMKREIRLEETRRQTEIENQALLDEELQRIREMAKELENTRLNFERNRQNLIYKNQILSERLKTIRNALETGDAGSIVKSSQALWFEATFINRLIVNVREKLSSKEKRQKFKSAGIKWDSWEIIQYDNMLLSRENDLDISDKYGIPKNKSVVIILEKKRYLGRIEPIMILEATVISHSRSYLENGFDNISVSLSEILSRIDKIFEHDDKDTLHVMYIASPTGFDDAVRDHFSGTSIGSGLLHQNVIVFLQDLQNPSENPIYNNNDPKASIFTDICRMGLDIEYVNTCKDQIIQLLEGNNPHTFEDLNTKIHMDPFVITQALNELIKSKTIRKDVHKNFETIYYKQ